MKTPLLSLLVAALFATCSSLNAEDLTSRLPGTWQGTLEAGSIKLRAVFNISAAADGSLTATMDSPDQGARGIPVEKVTLAGTALTIEVPAIRGVYSGTLEADGSTATGQWTQGMQTLPLNLTKGPALTEATPTPAEVAAAKAAAEKLIGTWNGTLSTGATGLRLRVNLTKNSDGLAVGTMDSLDQNAMGIPISAVTLSEDQARFEVRGVGGVYEGRLSADGTTLGGQWQQGGSVFPLQLQKEKTE